MAKKPKDGWTTQEIMDCYRRHLNEGRPVTLYNTFHGVPITYEADVAMIHHDFIGLIVHPYQTVCIKKERRTFIESKLLETLVRGYPVSIDFTNQVVLLKDLRVPKSISTDLYNSWVAPEKTIAVEISSDGQGDLKAPLAEIAVLDQNQIHVAMNVPQDVPYSRQDAVELAFRVAPKSDLVQVQGIVNSLAKIRNRELRRMEVVGTAAMGDEISILAYVAQREDQIMGALDKNYKKLRKGKKHG